MDIKTKWQVASPVKKGIYISVCIFILIFVIGPLLLRLLSRDFASTLLLSILFPIVAWAYILAAILMPVCVGLVFEKPQSKKIFGIILATILIGLCFYLAFNPVKLSFH
jgi:MFS-type transporter involved in bile tolerance (Atg22 family)